MSESPSPIKTIIEQFRQQPGGLLPLLHALQDHLGYVPANAVESIAQALNLSRAEVHGVLTYYHHFRTTPPAKTRIAICRAEACQAMGATQLYHHACKQTGCAPAADPVTETTTRADGMISIEPVYCLGLCATAPSLLWNGELFARVTPARFDALAQRHAVANITVSS